MNIVSGQVADHKVNVQDAVAIGTKQMQEFEKSWPEGFGSTISKKVKTVADSKKHIKVGSKKVYDNSVIYSRVIGIQASSREIDIKKVLSHDLAPVLTSMFLDSGAMRICKAKSRWMALQCCGLYIGRLKVLSPTSWRISRGSC